MIHRLAVLGRFLPVLALAIAGCGELRQPPPASDTAEVRVLHASPDAPPLDLYVEPMKPVFKNVVYGNATSFQSVGVGSQRLLFTRAGAPQEQLLGVEVDLRTGEKVDLVAAGESTGALHVVMLFENNTPPDAGTARLRVLNASPDGTPISMDLGNDGSIELRDLMLFQDSGEQGLEIPAGSTQPLGIAIGTEHIGSFIIPPLPAGGSALLVPTGYVARDPSEYVGLSLLAPGLGLVKQDPILYFLHLVGFSTDPNPSLDIYSFTGLVISDLKFGELVRIPVKDGASPSACLHGVSPRFCFLIATAGLQPGHEYLGLELFNPLDGLEPLTSHLFNGTFDLGQADPQLRFINAAYRPGVDVGSIDGGQFTVFDGYAQLGYFDDSGSRIQVLPPGSRSLGLQLSGTPTLYRFETVLSPGSRSFAIFGPPPAGTSGPQLYLIDTITRPWSRTVLSPVP